MDTARIILILLMAALASADPEKPPAALFEIPGKPTPQCSIDEAVFARLEKLGIEPARLCSDHVFLRRVYLDVIGTLPTSKETRQFLASRSPNKRRALVNALLQRPEFADYWAMRWSDVLRLKAEFPINLWPNAAMAYYRWLHTSLKRNKPYDQFVRELLTSSGSNFRVPAVNFYRALQGKDPEALAKGAALTFMGTRAEKWEKPRLDAFAAIFSCVAFKGTQEWKEEIIFFDSMKAAKAAGSDAAKAAALPDGTPVKMSCDKDPREVFADWLITPTNPWFARNIVNRTWAWLQGRGIIHEPDDIRPDNPPTNPELLAALETEFVAAKYDFKRLLRTILNSTTYQLSAIPRSDHAEAEAQFAFYPVRRLDAEVLIDALCQITATGEQYSSAIPEPFTFIPEYRRSIALPDGSISSSFLEMFGRPPRDTGHQLERTNTPTAGQRLHMLNSTHIRRKIGESRTLGPIIAAGTSSPRSAAVELYLTILSRYPTEKELDIVVAYGQGKETKGEKAMTDLAWALVNSTEFLYRH